MVGGPGMGILLALTVAAPTVGVRSTGQAPCDSAAFAQALKVLRPELSVEVLDASSHLPADGRVATLEWSSPGQAVLRVTGSATPLVRPITDPECKRVVQTAASIVDGLLEELPTSPAPSLDLSGGWWS